LNHLTYHYEIFTEARYGEIPQKSLKIAALECTVAYWWQFNIF